MQIDKDTRQAFSHGGPEMPKVSTISTQRQRHTPETPLFLTALLSVGDPFAQWRAPVIVFFQV